ncbi:hypothetical protein BOX15_Mlig020413g1 [Macrostomum lignano]|uniref:DGCR8 n=1 Tax=Macrostomum lignano TaxID=282301 RepID=A0A267GCA2_9PLAT|nr:hypothetical protein BOX15_Mlig020413g1 [Macrostomum lignano]
MATASPVATAAAAVAPGSNRGTPQHQHHQNHRRQFYGVRIPVEEDPENFVPVANADSPANATGGSGEKFFTASVSSIDREFAPKPPFRLPPSWIPIDHTSGLTMYLHKPTKVVTLARPYFAGSVALRNHLIPVACLPCLGYRRGLEAAGLLSSNSTSLKASRGVHTDCDMVDIVLPLSTDSPQSAEPQPQPQQQPAQDGIESGKEQLEVPNAAVAEDSPAAPAAPAAPAEDSDAEEGEITSSEDGNDSDDADKDKKKKDDGSSVNNGSRKRPVEVAATSVDNKRPRWTSSTSLETPTQPPSSPPPPPPPPPPPLPSSSISICPASSSRGGAVYLSHAEVREYCRRLFRYKTEQRQLCQHP